MKNKALKTLTLTTVAATALVTQQAYADEVVEVATSSSSNTANVEVSSSVTAEQVAAAKAAADAAANPVAYQQDSLVSAEAAAKTAQTNLDQAEQALTSAQDLATNATEETIAAAEKAIVSAEQTVVEAQNQVTSAEQATAIAQEQVDKAQAEANKAKTDADLAKSQADTSKAELEALQNSQEGRAISQAQAELKTAQEDVANKTTAVTTAKQNLEQAQAADTKLETDRASANAVLAEQKPKVKAAQDLVTEKEVDLETAKQNLVVANEKVEAVKPKATYKFSINLPDYLRDAYANLVKTDFSKDSIDAAIQAEKRYYGDIKAVDEIDKLSYATIESTDPTLYDVENLDIEQLLLLNQFAIDYTNAYRQVLGIDKKIVGNEWLIQVADVRARLYEEKYPEGFYGHDLEIIGAANDEVFGEASSMASNHEILAYPKFSSSGGLYEQNTKYYTMSEILHVIAQGINSFMLNDSGSAYGHFGSLMTYETMGFDLCFTYGYFEEYQSGVGKFVVVGAGKRTTEYMQQEYKNWDIFEETDSEITLGDPKTKYIGLEGEVLYGWSVTLPKKSYEIYNRLVERNISSQDYSAYESALKDQNAAQSSYNNVQAEYEKAAKELAKAQNDLSSAQSTYNELVNTALKTPEAKKALELAQTDLASAQEVLVTAQNQWQAAEVKAKALATKIAKAQADYDNLLATATTLKAQADDRKAEVATVQSVLTQAQNKLTEARQAVERAEQGVVSAKTNLSTLKEAQVTLVKAQAAYAVAQKNAQAANQSLSETRAKLADLKLVYEKAYTKYLDLKKLYDLQTMVTPQPTVDSDNQTMVIPQPAVDSDNSKENLGQGDSSQNDVKTSSNTKVKLATNKDLSKTDLNEISIAAATTEHKFAKEQTLPATGENETSLLSLLGLTALATGLGLAARRRQNG
ncbi:TPA: SEC10/PgrA surface exclusion domain-containing protein [Streptococcus suis]|uniref:SEC10/PgrA surface exclusion domain-containing protein n=4 Tax=Streptococcus suis TaxID=1307 RepID=UPI000C17B3E3|nr:SEC10/PgrA surface exclusion domain-containing protein [Streptococcus suis]NQM23425.1 SEC10/PgrA surface exclusion domain-containing protein [Streptococcus suis]HEM4273680.1 SEC10/PgrA surface exclusion domain-containing protein [Streptococcus suis]HEM5170978.1 SEC10/PgrA surface exclusion domain-containing protein [Streptococcus suis]HEM5285667.1 SEC10/PgrA surface exclusion domain-containing protein [Streptococcus suis]HEM6412840.1 SEC10/PgrA surface exclusion domain-containing protein [S